MTEYYIHNTPSPEATLIIQTSISDTSIIQTISLIQTPYRILRTRLYKNPRFQSAVKIGGASAATVRSSKSRFAIEVWYVRSNLRVVGLFSSLFFFSVPFFPLLFLPPPPFFYPLLLSFHPFSFSSMLASPLMLTHMQLTIFDFAQL